MVEDGEKWSKNGGACISWFTQDQSTGVVTRWCSGKTKNHERRFRNWRISAQYTPHRLTHLFWSLEVQLEGATTSGARAITRRQNISSVMTFCSRGPTSAARIVSAALRRVSSQASGVKKAECGVMMRRPSHHGSRGR